MGDARLAGNSPGRPSELSLHALAAVYEAGASASEIAARVFDSIDFSDPVWIAPVPRDAVLQRARALDDLPPAARAELPLFGVPFAVKDNIDVAGVATTAGCPAFAYMPERSAAAVQRLERAGAIAIGKTNLDQFATGLVGTRSPYGVPVNPYGAEYIPGGSSSGSAVAVARGLVGFALGTDTAGSGRVPAGFTATVGLKPTLGTIATTGVVPACRSLDCVSIFARSTGEAAAVYDAAAGVDDGDPFSRPRRLPGSALPAEFTYAVPVPEQRIFFGDDEAQRVYENALARLAALGGKPLLVDLTACFETARLLYDGPFVAERTVAVGDFVDANPDAVLDVTRSIIASGRHYSAVDTFAALYRLQALRARAAEIFKHARVLVVPTAPTIYRLSQIAAEPYLLNARLGTYTNFVNLLDWCALAVPAGSYASGLPIGVTFIAPAFEDATLVGLASRFAQAVL
jgi:allophanate hydrolase